ncbi:MAG: iron-containing alcohol dehydrogenase [Solirubrobacterales bacterium]
MSALPNARDFTWHDGPRVVRFGEGTLANVHETLDAAGWAEYELLSTPRALGGAPAALIDGAATVHEVPQGKVADTSAALLDAVHRDRLVAFGGGRVIDTSKAIAAVRGSETAAIPTTLSGAELTGIHRLPAGHSAASLNRPALVVADPTAMTDLPDDKLRATALNSLGHGADALFGPAANPFSTDAALRGIELVAAALDSAEADRDRVELALGSLFCAHAIDGAGLSLHHALCQELVRGLGIPHAETNAAMLPHTMAAMREREPGAIEALAEGLGTDLGGLEDRLTELGGGPRRLADLDPDRSGLDGVLDSVHARIEGAMRDPLSREALADLVQAAW